MIDIRKEAKRLRYRGATYYLHEGIIYGPDLQVLIPEATNGFLDLYEYFEYFPQPQVQHPCRGCVYFKACGDLTRTAPCAGRATKREQKRARKD